MGNIRGVKEIKVVGPLGNPVSGGGWYGITEDGVLSQARFVDSSAAWIAHKEYMTPVAKVEKKTAFFR